MQDQAVAATAAVDTNEAVHHLRVRQVHRRHHPLRHRLQMERDGVRERIDHRLNVIVNGPDHVRGHRLQID